MLADTSLSYYCVFLFIAMYLLAFDVMARRCIKEFLSASIFKLFL